MNDSSATSQSSARKIEPHVSQWVGLLGLAFLLFLLWWGAATLQLRTINDYTGCTTYPGAKILETYPLQCMLPDGRSFTESTEGGGISPMSPSPTVSETVSPEAMPQ